MKFSFVKFYAIDYFSLPPKVTLMICLQWSGNRIDISVYISFSSKLDKMDLMYDNLINCESSFGSFQLFIFQQHGN